MGCDIGTTDIVVTFNLPIITFKSSPPTHHIFHLLLVDDILLVLQIGYFLAILYLLLLL